MARCRMAPASLRVITVTPRRATAGTRLPLDILTQAVGCLFGELQAFVNLARGFPDELYIFASSTA
jgi:hypothetical protein